MLKEIMEKNELQVFKNLSTLLLHPTFKQF